MIAASLLELWWLRVYLSVCRCVCQCVSVFTLPWTRAAYLPPPDCCWPTAVQGCLAIRKKGGLKNAWKLFMRDEFTRFCRWVRLFFKFDWQVLDQAANLRSERVNKVMNAIQTTNIKKCSIKFRESIIASLLLRPLTSCLWFCKASMWVSFRQQYIRK